ncbi:hypothetical protein EJ04DRAFT_96019 [Polyplosphaeria fusca]|uniref:Uncharacterized protein n=1 Tax=Polyplosphaeria fusca TaxID=682080 RepID=A0A9P4R439_9PLEO|nr:hypothetical protein EJ04DRAFT_96019 [Polyplosphaeria fusca]
MSAPTTTSSTTTPPPCRADAPRRLTARAPPAVSAPPPDTWLPLSQHAREPPPRAEPVASARDALQTAKLARTAVAGCDFTPFTRTLRHAGEAAPPPLSTHFPRRWEQRMNRIIMARQASSHGRELGPASPLPQHAADGDCTTVAPDCPLLSSPLLSRTAYV